MHHIAIIGSGFSGSLVAVHLLRNSAGLPLRVTLIDRTGVFGPGLAYGNGSESLLLNVVAGRMSAFPDEPGDFLQWARKADPSVRGEMFLPRRMYGRYLSSLLDTACAESAMELVRKTDEATGLRCEGAEQVVVCKSGDEVRADAVVIASGNSSPSRPSWCDAGLESSGRYVGDPWRGTGLAGVGNDERVIIVGAGLTMMDVALSLNERGHRATIDVVSRRGLLSQPHRHGNPGLAKLPDPLVSHTFSSLPKLLRVVRDHAARAEAMGGDWRDAVNAMRSITPALWGALDERERKRFLDHLLPFWNTHRHRSPPSVAEGIEKLEREGRLRVHSGRIRCVRTTPKGVEMDVQRRGVEGAAGVTTLSAERIINCTGPDSDSMRSGDELTRQLFASGLARPGPLGMGIDFDDLSRVVRADGRVEKRVYLIGPAKIGKLWETTAVPELRMQAADIARRVVEDLGGIRVGMPRVEVTRTRAGTEPTTSG